MKKRKNIIIYSVVLVAIVLTVSLTYAYLSVSDKQLNTNNFTSGCLSISIENESAAINLTNAYPISDKEGLELEAYTFTIKNNCSTATNYEINLESLNETEDTLNGDYVKVAISSDTNENILSVLTDNDIKTNLIEGSYASHNLYTGSIEGIKTKSKATGNTRGLEEK